MGSSCGRIGGGVCLSCSVAVYYSVLQCIAVHCSVLQCVAVRRWEVRVADLEEVCVCVTVLQCVANVMQRGVACCSVLQCVAVCCSVL